MVVSARLSSLTTLCTTDIRKAIGLNDKFLMIRDLFGGDANLYEDTINHLNEYDD